MEIKILCGCGAKYKFDVEPVNGQMPKAVQCPVCGADGTTQSNHWICQQLAAAPSVPVAILLPSTPPPQPGPVTLAPMPAAPLPPATPSPAAPRIALRVGHTATAPPAEAEAVPAAPYEGPFPLRRGAVGGPLRSQPMGVHAGSPEGGVREISLGFKGWGIILVVLALLIGWPVAKWYLRAKRESLLAKVFTSDSKDGQAADLVVSNLAALVAAAEQNNFLADDSTVLVVRHGNDAEVAQACVDFWRDRLRRKLTLVSMKDGLFEEGQIGVKPVYNGFVALHGPEKWPKPQAEALVAHLSQKFNTLGLLMADSTEGLTFHFGIYQGGQKNFRAEYSLQKNEGDTVTEGRDWALKQGYKPEDGDWSAFESMEADALMKKMGLKLWGQPDLSYSFMLKQ